MCNILEAEAEALLDPSYLHIPGWRDDVDGEYRFHSQRDRNTVFFFFRQTLGHRPAFDIGTRADGLAAEWTSNYHHLSYTYARTRKHVVFTDKIRTDGPTVERTHPFELRGRIKKLVS